MESRLTAEPDMRAAIVIIPVQDRLREHRVEGSREDITAATMEDIILNRSGI